MTFLTPLPMLIALGLGLPALTLLYILKLRRRPVRVSSTMLWEQAVQDLEVNEPFRRFRPSLMFLLHALILACFALAMGRPVLDSAAARARDVVIVIDRSASMSAADAASSELPGPALALSRTRLDAAKSAATALVNDMARGSSRSFAIITYAAEPVFLGRAPDAASAAALIASITPTDQPGRPALALELAETLARSDTSGDPNPAGASAADIAPETAAQTDDGPAARAPVSPESASQPLPAIIHFFTDAAAAEPVLLAASPLAPRLTRTAPNLPTPNSPASNPTENLALVALSALRDDPDNPARVRLYLRVQSTFDRPLALPLAIRVGSGPPQRTTLRVPLAARDAAGLIPASASRTLDLLVPADAPDDADRVVSVTIERDDALPADNTAALVVPRAATPSIALVAPGSPADPTIPAPDPFLLNVLDALTDRTERLFTPADAPRLIASPGLADLIILDRVPIDEWPLSPALLIGVPPPGLTVRTIPGPVTPLLRWDRQSAPLRDAALDSLILGRRLTIDTDSPEARALSARSLAQTADGTVIASFDIAGTHHLWFGFELAQSNWPVQVSFPIVLAAAADHLAARPGLDPAPRRTAEPVRVALPAASLTTADAAITARVITPDGAERTVPVTPAGTASLGLVDRVGTYRVRALTPANSPATPWSLAPVNLLDAAESSLAVGPVSADSAAVAQNASADRRSGPRSLELWWPLVLTAFILLAIEWLLWARASRIGPVSPRLLDHA